jgi:dethiobiotin synthetase
MSAIFITSTGTDIGKTFVATGLVRHWRGKDQPVDALKPVATGFDAVTSAASDPGLILAALGHPISLDGIDRISPWRYAAPLSPDMASWKEGKAVDFDALVEFCRRAIANHQGTLLIEGIGGVMVPLDDRRTVLDWMAALGIPVLLVAGSYLGSLSHTLTALDALRRRAIAVSAIVLNETPGSTASMADTRATLQRFAGPIPIVTLARGATDLSEIAALL